MLHFLSNRPIAIESTMVSSSSSSSSSASASSSHRYQTIICNVMLLTLTSLVTIGDSKHNGFNTLRGSTVDKYHYSFNSPLSLESSSSSSSSSSSASSPSSNFPWNHHSPSSLLISSLTNRPTSTFYNQNQSDKTLGKRSTSGDNLPNHVMRDSCSDDSECLPSKTKCMVKQGLCSCSQGYITVDLLTTYNNMEESSYVSKFCYKLKRNGEPCEHSAQCFVSHATCERINPPILNNQSGTCQCKQGFNEQAGNEVTDVNGYEITSERICVPVVVVVNKTYIKITVALSVLTILALIGCTIIVIKIKRNKRQAQTETAVATSINGPGAGHHQGQGGPYGPRDLGNPPPMGSAEAEFQNDFIQVFPMHHLEPCPEKNMTALIMQ